jgi:hypothetical protein
MAIDPHLSSAHTVRSTGLFNFFAIVPSIRWFILVLHHFMRGCVSRDDIPKKVKQQIAIQKFMLTVI